MSNTRGDLRLTLENLVDSGAGTDYSDAEYNYAINQALQQLSTALPVKQHTTGTVTGTAIDLPRPAQAIDYVIINGTYWQPLTADHPDFASGYYDAVPNEDQTLLALGAAQSAAPYTVSYWAPTDYMDNDTDGGHPDIHKHILFTGAIAALLSHRLAEANAAATDTDLMTFLRSSVNAYYGRFYEAISLATEIQRIGITTRP